MSHIKIVSEKTIFKAKLFDVYETEIVLPNGEKRIHHNAKRHPTVTVFPLTQAYDIYLVSQYRYLHKKVTIEAMAGFIDSGETSLQAAKRELKEETGLTATHWEELARAEFAASVFKGTAHLFLAKGLEPGESNPEPGEEITIIKMSLEDAVKKVILGEINHSASMIGILMLDRLRRKKKL